MTEKDKKNLFGGKKSICTFFQKQKAIREINSLIKDADNILNTYPEVDFNNVFITALQQSSRILFEEQLWAEAADNFLLKLFNNQQSDIRKSFNSILPPDAVSDYAKTRYKLSKKRELLNALLNDLED